MNSVQLQSLQILLSIPITDPNDSNSHHHKQISVQFNIIFPIYAFAFKWPSCRMLTHKQWVQITQQISTNTATNILTYRDLPSLIFQKKKKNLQIQNIIIKFQTWWHPELLAGCVCMCDVEGPRYGHWNLFHHCPAACHLYLEQVVTLDLCVHSSTALPGFHLENIEQFYWKILSILPLVTVNFQQEF